MKIMPFLAVGYVIAGLANLGLPGFSGFIAEMTIFVGSFGAHPMSGDPNTSFRMVATIIACMSIVVTAVYILRVVGKILYGEVENKHFLELTDATWDERVAVICLIFCVAGLGSFPFWVSDIISPAAGTILESIGVM
jgi:NADH-quinone oxidoreductase subunit M